MNIGVLSNPPSNKSLSPAYSFIHFFASSVSRLYPIKHKRQPWHGSTFKHKLGQVRSVLNFCSSNTSQWILHSNVNTVSSTSQLWWWKLKYGAEKSCLWQTVVLWFCCASTGWFGSCRGCDTPSWRSAADHCCSQHVAFGHSYLKLILRVKIGSCSAC